MSNSSSKAVLSEGVFTTSPDRIEGLPWRSRSVKTASSEADRDLAHRSSARAAEVDAAPDGVGRPVTPVSSGQQAHIPEA